MARKRKEPGATFYKSDVDFVLDPETTEQEKACFGDAIAHVIAEDYDFRSPDKMIRSLMAIIAERIKAEKDNFREIAERRAEAGQASAAARWGNDGITKKSFVTPDITSVTPDITSVMNARVKKKNKQINKTGKGIKQKIQDHN